MTVEPVTPDKKQVQFELPESSAAYDLAKRFFANAVKAGDIEVCEKILKRQGYYINDMDSDGFTQLYYAACSGQTELCKMMLERGASPNFVNVAKAGSLTPFEAAIANNHTATAKVMLDYLGSESLAALRGRNPLPLFLAIQNRNQDIVEALIAKGADVHSPGKFNAVIHTPLYFAVCLDDVTMCQTLVDAGAQLKGSREPDVQMSDIFFVTALSQSQKMCEFLFECKYDTNTLNAQRRNVLQQLLRHRKPFVYHKDVDAFATDRTPFTVTGPYASVIPPVPSVRKDGQAGKSRMIEFVKLFIDHGTNVNHRDQAGCSVLDTLFLTQMESGHSLDDFEKLLDLLIEAKVDLKSQDKNGWAALHYMLFYLFLCEQPEQEDDANAFVAAVPQQAIDELRLDAGSFDDNVAPFDDVTDEDSYDEAIDVDYDDPFGATNDKVSTVTVSRDEPVATEVKTESAKKPDAKSKFDDRRIAIFMKLIEAGADVTQADKQGNTLLHYAASPSGETIERGDFDITLNYETGDENRDFCRKLMELLIDHGASIATENNAGETPLDWARQGGPWKSQTGPRSGGMGGYGGGGYGGGMGGFGGGGYGGGGMAAPMPSTPALQRSTNASPGSGSAAPSKAQAVDMLMMGK